MEPAALGARGAVGAADEHGAQVLGAGLGAGVPALAGAAGADAGPGGEARGVPKVAAGPGLDENGGGRGAVDAGDGLEQAAPRVVLGQIVVDAPLQVGEAPVQRVVLVEQVGRDEAVGLAQGHRQGIAEPIELGAALLPLR